MHPLSRDILPEVQTKKIPATSFMRMWCLGSTNARIAVNYLSYALQKHFLNNDQRQQAKNKMQLKAAIQLLGTMGYLRGAIMKLGQFVGNLPQIMDKEIIEIFESLHFEAPPMHYPLIREVFLDELEKDPEDVFASFEQKAFAAASLGQVHKAQLHDGTPVAVKIQYPNIARTINADFKNLSLLLKAIQFKEDYKYLYAHISDAKEVFSQEVNYLSEALYMDEHYRTFEGSEIVVPKFIPELTTKKVLTMEYLPGKHLGAFLEDNPSQRQRDHYGYLISYALVHSFFQHRTIYADLHPGNFLFMPDGRLGFLDFGCYRRFSPDRWLLQVQSEAAMYSEDEDTILKFLTKFSCHNSPDDLDPEWVDLALRQLNWIIRPVTAGGIFNFTDNEYVEEGVNLIKESLQKGHSRTDCFYNFPNRAILGHRSLMYRLGCRLDYSSLYLEHMNLVTRGNNPA